MTLVKIGLAIPVEPPLPVVDTVIGVARIGEEDAFASRSEMLQLVEDHFVHQGIAARQALAEEGEIGSRLNFRPIHGIADRDNLEPIRLGKLLIHFIRGVQQIEICLEREASAIIVLESRIEQGGVLGLRVEIGIDVRLQVDRQRFEEDPLHLPVKSRLPDQFLVEDERFDRCVHAVVKGQQTVVA